MTGRTKTGCIFCDTNQFEILAENNLAFAIRDKYPIRPLHTLAVPKRHVIEYFDLNNDELADIQELLRYCRQHIIDIDVEVGGFNVGANVGFTAGQKIEHVHVHLIPRRHGDTPPPPAKPPED